jgi:hypothetical protein
MPIIGQEIFAGTFARWGAVRSQRGGGSRTRSARPFPEVRVRYPEPDLHPRSSPRGSCRASPSSVALEVLL